MKIWNFTNGWLASTVMARRLSLLLVAAALPVSVAFAREREPVSLEMLEYLGTYEVTGKNGVDPTQLEKVDDEELRSKKSPESGTPSGSGKDKNVKQKSGDRNGR